MKVCHIINGSCCRVHRLAMAQRTSRLVTPYLLNYFLNPVHPYKQYEAIFRYQQTDAKRPDPTFFLRTIRTLDKIVDLFHVHNEQDWIAPWVRRATDKPIIWDVHDMASLQKLRDDYREDEDASADVAQHLFCPGPAYEKILSQRYPKPVSWYPSAVPREMFPILLKAPSREGIVYEGGFRTEKWSHREWGPFLEKAAVPVVVFSAFSTNYHPPANVTYCPIIPPDLLLRTMRFFEAGILGSPGFGPHPQLQGVMPNKLFEYTAAGLPVIAVQPPEDVANFIHENKNGIIIKRPEEVLPCLETFRADPTYRARAAELREKWTMDDAFMNRVYPIYQKLTQEK